MRRSKGALSSIPVSCSVYNKNLFLINVSLSVQSFSLHQRLVIALAGKNGRHIGVFVKFTWHEKAAFGTEF